MKKKLTVLNLSLLTIFSVLIFANTANAQRRPNWANRNYTKKSVSRVIANVENRVDRFVGQLDTALDHSRLDGKRRENVLNDKAKQLETATDELRSEFDNRESWWETRSNVQSCLDVAADIDVAMRRQRLGKSTENNWKNVRAELNALAKVYGLPAMRAYR